MNIAKIKTYNCPVEAAISGTKRYNEIQKALPQATPRMLSKQLKELEDDGVIKRVLYPIVPPKTEYSLTEMGITLGPIMEALCKWGEHYFKLAGISIPHDE